MAKFVFSVTCELTSESPIDSCQEELSPSDPIESVCLLFQPPSLLLTVTSTTTIHPFPLTVAIGLNPPESEDNPTQIECMVDLGAYMFQQTDEFRLAGSGEHRKVATFVSLTYFV